MESDPPGPGGAAASLRQDGGPRERGGLAFPVRWTRPAAVALALGGLIFLALAFLTGPHWAGWGYDFDAYLLAAQRLVRGDGIYQQWTLDGPFRPGFFGLYLYAPPLAVVVTPFTLLSPPVAGIIWYVLHVGLLALACRLMPVRTDIRLLAFAVGAFSEPVVVDSLLGNISLFVLALLAAAWRWLDRPTGSVALAAAMSLRPTLGIFLAWFLLRGRLRAFAWVLLGGLGIIVLTLPMVGLAGYLDYLTVLRNLSDLTGVFNNMDLGSTMLRLGLGPQAATAALFAGYAIGIGAMLLGLRRDREVGFMATLGATLLMAPLLWDHYLASLLLPAALLAHRGRPWALALPLLAWLPTTVLPFVAIGATALPFLAPDAAPGQAAPAAPAAPPAAGSKRTVSPG